MCGRYTVVDPKLIAQRYKVKKKMLEGIKANFNVSPTQTMPVITNRDGTRDLEFMKWGIIPVWAKDKPSFGFKTFNARAETLAEKPMWKKSFATRRCIIPATGFYEWKKDGSAKTPYHICVLAEPIFSIAGIFDEYTDKDTGEVVKTYSIITTEANKMMQPLHDRMPVILPEVLEDDWLTPTDDLGFLESLLTPYDSKKMDAYQVSAEVGNSRNNYPDLIKSAA